VNWLPLGVLVLAQIGYPLVQHRAPLVVATVVLGFAISVTHAVRTRGMWVGVALVAVTTGGGLLVETLGVHTGHPFGRYGYSGALGPRLLGVPLVIPLAWTWLAWPAWLAAGRLTRRLALRIPVAGLGLAAWDLFLDPQMVAEGYWHWAHPRPGLPGVPGVPLTNYLGWLLVATLMMAVFAGAAGARGAGSGRDGPMFAMYLWTFASSVLAHAVFLRLPGSAAWGALGMGLVAVPLAVVLWRR
jgi:putative membrane protein